MKNRVVWIMSSRVVNAQNTGWRVSENEDRWE